jgi:hypothetical protein
MKRTLAALVQACLSRRLRTQTTARLGMSFSAILILALSGAGRAQQPAAQEPALPQMTEAEGSGYIGVTVLASAEKECRKRTGRYVGFDELLRSCDKLGPSTIKDPREDKFYQFEIKASPDSFTVTAKPRNADMAGFFSDGKRVYYNVHGAASAGDLAIYDLETGTVLTKGPAKPKAPPEAESKPEQPQKAITIYDTCPSEVGTVGQASPAPHAAKVWTNEDMPAVRAAPAAKPPVKPPPPVLGCVLDDAGTHERLPVHSFNAAERRSLRVQCAIDILEMECSHGLKRVCPLDELTKGVPSQALGGGTEYVSLVADPKTDPDYEYRLSIGGSRYTLSAVPKHPGLGGFFSEPFPYPTHYNANGEASKQDPKTALQVSCGGFTQTRK